LKVLRFLYRSGGHCNSLLPDCYRFTPPRCLSNACRNAWSTRDAASACIPGNTCE